MPIVTTNTAANSALRFLNENNSLTGSSISKLASGSRIVTAADDAAGLAIGTRLRADSTVLEQSLTNAAQGVSVIQVADGGLARISDVLQRLKALAAQSLSGVPTDVERAFVDAEYQQLIDEISGIASSTRFNGESLLDGTGAQFSKVVDFFVGVDVEDVISLNISSLAANVSNFTSKVLGGLPSVPGQPTVAGNAKANPPTQTIPAVPTVPAVPALSSTAVDTASAAASAFASIDAAIDQISEARANLGSFISRFEFRQQQIATSKENIDAANSSILDVDIAVEQSKLVSSQVLVQASVAALSQANQLPQSLLRLLQ